MRYTPPIQRKRATFFATLFFAIALLSYILSLTGITKPLIFQLITLITACTSVYIAVRYLFTSVTYILRVNGDYSSLDTAPREAVDFTVMKTQGKREAAMECLLSLKYLTRLEIYSEGLVSSLKREYKSPKFYYYTVSVKPAERQILVFEDGTETNCIVAQRLCAGYRRPDRGIGRSYGGGPDGSLASEKGTGKGTDHPGKAVPQYHGQCGEQL